MPYFVWRGVDIQASIHKGHAYAESVSHLDELLFKKNIALLNAREKALPFFYTHISNSLKIQWLRQLALLLKSGVPILRALHIVRAQETTALYDATTMILKEVEQGTPLFQALAQSAMFDYFVIAMTRAGGEAGDLAYALNAAAYHQERKDVFARKMKMAALVPGITLLIFFVVMGVIFRVIMPKFAALYGSMHKELPWITRALFEFNNTVFEAHGVMYGAVMLGAVLFYMQRTRRDKKIFYQLPLLGDLHKQACVLEYMSMCALLTQQGVPLVPALKIAHQGVVYEDWHAVLAVIIERVEAGSTLSSACAQYAEAYIESDCIACIAVGEESGTLPHMFSRIVEIMQGRFEQKLSLITTLFQPVLIIILGFCVMLLLMASYMPIFTMSYSM